MLSLLTICYTHTPTVKLKKNTRFLCEIHDTNFPMSNHIKKKTALTFRILYSNVEPHQKYLNNKYMYRIPEGISFYTNKNNNIA